MNDAQPVLDPGAPWMKHLEHAHALAHQAARIVESQVDPNPHMEPAARKLEGGLVALYDAFRGRGDRPSSIGRAHARLWDAAMQVAQAGLPNALAALRAACDELVSAEERIPRVPLAVDTTRPLATTKGTLPLHALERDSISPSFRAPPLPAPATPAEEMPALPEPTTFEELAQVANAMRKMADERREQLRAAREDKPRPFIETALHVPDGFAKAPPRRLSESDFVRNWARECFEEVGMLGLQRAPMLGDDWRAIAALEKRLIAALDALAALGPKALVHAETLAMDAPAADPSRVFAVTMIGGCVEGRDTLAGAERVLHRFGVGDPLVADAFVAAMKLVPHPFAANVAHGLLSADDVASRAVGLEILAFRGSLDDTELNAIAYEKDPRLMILALHALASARNANFDALLANAKNHEDAAVQRAALEAMALAAHDDAATAARKAVKGPLGHDALLPLSIVGGLDDAQFVLDRVKRKPTRVGIEAVGWTGLVRAVPWLLEWLKEDEEEIKLAAGAALDRILGAQLVDTIEVDPEQLDETPVHDPDPDAQPERLPLAELVSEPRDLPPPGSPEELEVPAIDPEKWRAYWAEHKGKYRSDERLRRGRPYTTSVSLYELDQLHLSGAERRMLHRELAAQTGYITHFDPHDFVVVQEHCLEQWRRLVISTSATAGGWDRPKARHAT